MTDRIEVLLSRWSERSRQAALALTSMLFVARACWPGEGSDELSTGLGLGWVGVAFLAVFLAIFAGLTGFSTRPRWRFADLAVLVFFALVAASSAHAADRRVAYNLAWHWVGVGFLYVLMRLLPRDEREQRALYIVLFSTAAALACYGLFQVINLYPEARRLYQTNPLAALRMAGVPGDPGSRAAFEQRLFSSQEPISTFSLANSLAGFLVGPLVLLVGWCVEIIASGNAARSRWKPVLLIACAAAPLLVCLLLTKSRTGYVGLLVGLILVAIRRWNKFKPRYWLLGGGILVSLVVLLVLAALATRQLDHLVLTESFKSLRYRWEYWLGTWSVLCEDGTWWSGLGPGNFAGPYLRHKLVVASEAIKDPHNALLEVWSTGGLPGLLAFISTLVLCVRALFSGSPKRDGNPGPAAEAAGVSRWLVLASGVGGLLLAMFLRPDLGLFAHSSNPFEGDTDRWAILLIAWYACAGLLLISARESLMPVGAASGSAAIAIVVNLLGAGGIGFAPVAAMLWCIVALGLNETIPTVGISSRLRVQRTQALLTALVCAALLGCFIGTIGPSWAAQSHIKRGDKAQLLAREAVQRAASREPGNRQAAAERERGNEAYRGAGAHFRDATIADPLSSRAWILWALVELEAWRARGAPVENWIWHRLKSQLAMARTPPRDPNAFTVVSSEFQVANQLLGDVAWPKFERQTLLMDRLAAAREAARLNPTSAGVQADRAYAAEALAEWAEALAAGKLALELDATTPHRDRKLPEAERIRLIKKLIDWQGQPPGIPSG